MYGRDPATENELQLLNVLREDKYVLDVSIFPKNRMANLRGKELKAVTFVRPADVYIGNSSFSLL